MQKKRLRMDFREWLRAAAAGFVISGSSGTGKSQLIRLIINFLARLDEEAIFLLDPSGQLVFDIQQDLASMPKSVRDRLVIIKPSAVRNGVAGPNPLAVAGTRDQLRWRAKIATKVKHMAMILLMAWGETDFNSKPLLFKWVTRFLMILALARLPVAAVRYFFDPMHAVYKALTRIAPDFITQMEMEDLAELRPRDREEIIASTKNRFLGLLSNPIVELLFSVTDNALDVRQLIRERKIVLISFETGEGELDDSDVEILANVYLMEIAFAIFNTPHEERQSTTVFIDELPLFKSSFPLLRKTMPLVRKLHLRWVMSFQGAFVFPEGVNDPLLNLALGQCGVHFIFGHGNYSDCEFFARHVGLSQYDSQRRKHTQVVPTQIQVGREIMQLYDEAVNWSDAEQEGGSEAAADTATLTVTEQKGSGTQESEQSQLGTTALANAVTKARSQRTGTSKADATGTTKTTGTNWATTRSRGGSRTKKSTVVPIMETIDVEHITWLTHEEQFLEIASEIAQFPVGRCIIHRRAVEMAVAQLPLLRSRLELTPKYAQKKLALLQQQVALLPFFTTVSALQLSNEEFTRQLVRQLDALAAQQSPPLERLPAFVAQNHPLLGI